MMASHQSPLRNAALRKLHAGVREAGIDDATYRDRLEREFGVRSAKELNGDQLVRAIGLFHVKPKANFPHTRLAKALWIALGNLGAVDRRDAALDAFVQRQTGKQKLAFLTPVEANRVSEALKAMCAREQFVVPALRDPVATRRALLEAQWAKLGAIGAVEVANKWALWSWLDKRFRLCHGGHQKLTALQLDEASKALGRWIRTELTKRVKAA